MIFGYPERPTVSPGEGLVLHVSTDAPSFCVDLYRFGSEMRFTARSEWFPGRALPHHLPYHDWGRDNVGLGGEHLEAWPAYEVATGADWEPGVYVAVLVEGDGNGGALTAPDGRTPDGRDAKALFVLRTPSDRASAPVLYKVPLLTYHAYNRVSPASYDPSTKQGGWSFYTLPGSDELGGPVSPAVSLHRPGGGTGGTPSDIWNFDPFDPTPRQTFVHWDAPFVAWLHRNGVRADYCTDLDVHDDGGLDLLRRHDVLVSVGHDEYWSDAMRRNVERFVREGGNVAFFGGNTCWWRVTFDDRSTFRRVATWSELAAPPGPENLLTGVSFRNGGERDLDDHPTPVGYQVQHADHWVYEGTGLADGDTFGDGADEYLVGYECDGAHFDRALLASGGPVTPSGQDGTPGDFTILGVGDVEPSGWGMGNKAATMGVHGDDGTVFTAATTDWARLLAADPHPVVERITSNVIDRLSAGGRHRRARG